MLSLLSLLSNTFFTPYSLFLFDYILAILFASQATPLHHTILPIPPAITLQCSGSVYIFLGFINKRIKNINPLASPPNCWLRLQY